MKVAGIAAVVVAAPVFAQWLNYKTPGIPRLPDSRPNLSAPAPRAGGHPDLSGIWQLDPAPCAPNAIQPCAGDYRGGREFGNIGASLPDGLTYQPWAAELVNKRRADLGKDDPVAWCKPAGALRLLTYPPYRKIIQTPECGCFSPNATCPTARSSPMGARCQMILRLPGTATQSANGSAARRLSRPSASARQLA